MQQLEAAVGGGGEGTERGVTARAEAAAAEGPGRGLCAGTTDRQGQTVGGCRGRQVIQSSACRSRTEPRAEAVAKPTERSWGT